MSTSQQHQSTMMNYSNYPLKDIPQPHDHDVLCGRGGGTNNHSKLLIHYACAARYINQLLLVDVNKCMLFVPNRHFISILYPPSPPLPPVGNSHWRMLVAANKQLYITLPKRQKMLLSRSIVNAVRSQNPPGRFLQKDGKTKLWFDVGDQRAQEKTSQALREGKKIIMQMKKRILVLFIIFNLCVLLLKFIDFSTLPLIHSQT